MARFVRLRRATLIQVREFDRYQGKGIPDGKVSLSFRLTFQAPDRTLTDAEVQAAMERIVDALMRNDACKRRLRRGRRRWRPRRRPAGLEPIDRLEEKIKLLVSVIVRLQASRRASWKTTPGCSAKSRRSRRASRRRRRGRRGHELRDERDQIRSRVSEMLQQLDGLNL